MAKKINWHTFNFPEYSVKGLDDSPTKLEFIKMPEDLTNWTCLDIGAWDGYFSFVAERRGAKVVAMDSPKHSWNREEIEIAGEKVKQDGKAVFLEAKEKLNSKVIDIEGELDELPNLELKPNWEIGSDLVLCLGILYHVEDPYKLIRDLYKITNKLLILETHIDINDAPFPAMRFYPRGEVNNDLGTFWGPNMMCVSDMLTKAGFKVTYADYKGGRGVFHAEKI
jgi:tRNA (mo5U34)-methyltransferase